MKSRLTRFGVAATVLAAATWTAGCSSMGVVPGAAAVVDGHTIVEKDLESIVSDLARMPNNAQLTHKDVLSRLITATIVREHAAELKAPVVSLEAMRAAMERKDSAGKSITPWHDVTIQAVRDVEVASEVIRSSAQVKAVELIQKANVRVNPKYGTFDAQRLDLSPASPNWMVPPAKSEAPGGQLPPGHPDPQGDQPTPQAPPTTPPAPSGTAPAATTQPATPAAPTTSK